MDDVASSMRQAVPGLLPARHTGLHLLRDVHAVEPHGVQRAVAVRHLHVHHRAHPPPEEFQKLGVRRVLGVAAQIEFLSKI